MIIYRYNPLYSANHIYFNEYLPAGTYNLSFHDPTGATTSDFTCAPYILSYNLSASPVPDDVCDYNPLPLELTTAAGTFFFIFIIPFLWFLC